MNEIVQEDGLDTQEQIIKECRLIIKKPDLIGLSKWGFVYNKQIEAHIEDEVFLKQVRSGDVNITGGSKLICDMLIQTKLDDMLNVLGTNYIIKKVHALKDKHEQMSFFDDASYKKKN